MQPPSETAELLSLREAATAELARPGRVRHFIAPLQGRYEADQAGPRSTEQREITAITLALYVVITLVLDLFVTADVGWWVVVFQVAIPTIAALTISRAYYQPSVGFWVRERAMFAGTSLVSLATVAAVAASPHSTALVNQFLVTLPVMISIVFLRLPFVYSAALVAITAAALAVLTELRTDLPTALRWYPFGFLLSASVPVLLAASRLERGTRRIYLHDLLQTLQIGHLAGENERLNLLSITDPLTGAANRRRLDHALAELCAKPDASDFLLLVDVDHFKRFNDLHGHVTGDACLRDVVAAMRQQLRKEDLLARFGGEEFAILLTSVTELEAQRTAKRLLECVANCGIPTADGETSVTVSIGVAPRIAGDDPRRLVMMADAALYAAKNTGRNCVRWPPQGVPAVAKMAV